MSSRTESAVTTRTRPQTGPRAPAREVRRRPAGRRPRVPNFVLTILVVLVLLAGAEFVAKQELVSRFIIAAPTDVIDTLFTGLSEGSYTDAIVRTVSAMLIGFGISLVVALVLAGVLTSLPRVLDVLLPIFIAFQSLPMVTVAPLVILWLGFGITGKIAIVAIASFFPMFINALHGLRARDREQVELMWSLGASRWQMLRYVRLPNAVPYLFAGFNIGIIFALIGAIVAEFVGSEDGLGRQLLIEKSLFNISGVYAILLIIMAFGITLHLITRGIEKRAALWAQDTSQARL